MPDSECLTLVSQYDVASELARRLTLDINFQELVSGQNSGRRAGIGNRATSWISRNACGRRMVEACVLVVSSGFEHQGIGATDVCAEVGVVEPIRHPAGSSATVELLAGNMKIDEADLTFDSGGRALGTIRIGVEGTYTARLPRPLRRRPPTATLRLGRNGCARRQCRQRPRVGRVLTGLTAVRAPDTKPGMRCGRAVRLGVLAAVAGATLAAAPTASAITKQKAIQVALKRLKPQSELAAIVFSLPATLGPKAAVGESSLAGS